jgi:Domain of unknown function (DUF4372)
MYQGKTILGALLEFMPKRHFEYLVKTYQANRYTKSFPAWAQFVCMAFAHLSKQKGLRDLEATLNEHSKQLFHLGIRQRPSRSTMADAAKRRDWRLFEAIGTRMIAQYQTTAQSDNAWQGASHLPIGMNAATISLCLDLFPWITPSSSDTSHQVIKNLDLSLALPRFIPVDTDQPLEPRHHQWIRREANTTVVLDSAKPDFAQLYAWASQATYFILHVTDSFDYEVVQDFPVAMTADISADQIILLTDAQAKKDFPEPIRLVLFTPEHSAEPFMFLTNHNELSANTVAQLYANRRDVVSFLEWLNLRTSAKHILGSSENAVRSHVWMAICVYVMVVTARTTLRLSTPEAQLFAALEVDTFSKITLQELAISLAADTSVEVAATEMRVLTTSRSSPNIMRANSNSSILPALPERLANSAVT